MNDLFLGTFCSARVSLLWSCVNSELEHLIPYSNKDTFIVLWCSIKPEIPSMKLGKSFLYLSFYFISVEMSEQPTIQRLFGRKMTTLHLELLTLLDKIVAYVH